MKPFEHRFPWPVVLLVLGFFALFSAFADAESSASADSELRLRGADPKQVERTTSVNWWDLNQLPVQSEPIRQTAVRTVNRPALKVLIDIGHGGRDLGAPGWNGILEKEIALKVGMGVKRELERHAKLKDTPIQVKLTRDEDFFIPLRGRVKQANDWGADLFLSVHANSSEFPRAQGFEVYFLSETATDAAAHRLARAENQGQRRSTQSQVESILSDVQQNLHVNESSRFAEVVFQAMSRRLRPNGRGVRQAPFTVLAGTKMPALLVEVGYVTNPDEAKKLSSGLYLKRIANAISTGIVEFATLLKKLG